MQIKEYRKKRKREDTLKEFLFDLENVREDSFRNILGNYE